jgi:hypothetical protein
MSSERGYGGFVDTEKVSQPLETTRVVRLALNVLWDGLPDEMAAAGPVYDALAEIHELRLTSLRCYPSRDYDDSLTVFFTALNALLLSLQGL